MRAQYAISALFVCTVPVLGCSESAVDPLEWKVDFACTDDAKATEKLTVRVLRDGCAGSDIAYEASFGRGETAPAKSLRDGTYGLSAIAEGQTGVIAELCEEHRLPSSNSITLVLRSASCAAGLDASTDASPPDAGLPDVNIPDADPPCMPPKDCRPCAADGNPSDCPPPSCNQFNFGPHTYLFCTDRQEWAAARTECRKTGRDLAIIENAEENTFITAHLAGNTHWIGANDRGASGFPTSGECPQKEGDEGTWRWVNGVSGDDKGNNFCNLNTLLRACLGVSGQYTSWSDNEPNNASCMCIPFVRCDEGEDCGAINTSGKWQDAVCGSDLPYICESY